MKRLILVLMFIGCCVVHAQQYPPYLMYDASGNPYPSGSGTALPYNPPPFTCYTNITGQTLPCNFSGGGSGTVSGQAAGVIPLGTSASVIGAQSHLTDNGADIISTLPILVPGTPGIGGASGATPGTPPDLTGTNNGGMYLSSVTNSFCYEYNSSICIPIASAVQARDYFTGASTTALTSHLDNNGHTWTAYNSITGNTAAASQLNGNNAAISPSGGAGTAGEYLNSLVPASPNYAVTMIFVQQTGTGQNAVLYARANSAAYTVYQCNYALSSGTGIYRVVAGTATLVSAFVAGNWTTGVPTVMTCSTQGNTPTIITLSVNGVVKNTYSDATPITAAGQAGFGIIGGSLMTANNFEVQ